ncbi:uncharacterized protein M421DRAFT_416473 [Didymella exigua CBS 183.55]|uniref:Uncharacterized protein n=1 Tax=Didymella exigua CBS 183.55 TaxID=1150837 RepID=A0A6A5RYF1_9PLEO|nr:uncharacterized protein M421DRAFT_416473 [Didymella exigua CBS 183.55]KAF1932872.1 hypothetical protein M421DRAFT_416473 [Didymella exigua CBS 183.55]
MYEAARSLVLGHMDTEAVFAAQMLYDIQQEVDPQHFPLEDILETVSLDYLRLYDKYKADWMNESVDGNRSTRLKRVNDQYNILRHIVYSEDDLQANLERWEHGTPRQHTIPGFNIVRHVPLLVGQMVAQYHEEFHDAFLDIANDRGHILTAIHFYNAAKQSGSLPPEVCWDDMEWVIDSQIELNLLGNPPADTSPKYLKNFCDAYGLDHSKFAIGHSPAYPEWVRNDIHLTGGSPKRLESCTKYVRACEDFKQLHKSSPGEWRLRMLQAFADYHLDGFSAHGSPNTIGVLIAAKEMYEGDEEALNFDIFDFHEKCAKLLSSVRRACFEYAPEDYPSVRYDSTEGLNTTIAELLRDLLACPRHHGYMWNLAVRLLMDVIKQDGSACEDMAFERLKMTTLDSISIDSDGISSDTLSAGSARSVVGTPPPDPTEIDVHYIDVEVSGTSKLRIREKSEAPDVPSKTPEHDSAGPPSPADAKQANELKRQQQLAVDDLMNLKVETLPNGILLLVSENGTVLASWPSHETPQVHEKLSYMHALLRECLQGGLNAESLENGDIIFYQHGKAKVVLAMPAFEFRILDGEPGTEIDG